MKEMKKLVFGILMIACLAAPAFAQSAAELYQQGLVQENGAGNLRNAIQLYERAAKESKGDRTTAALALMGAARCYEKLGQDESRKLYQEVANSYSDQTEQAALAREHLGGNFGGVDMQLIRSLARETTLGFMKSQLDGSMRRRRNSPNATLHNTRPASNWPMRSATSAGRCTPPPRSVNGRLSARVTSRNAG